jgi:hypothetical protein
MKKLGRFKVKLNAFLTWALNLIEREADVGIQIYNFVEIMFGMTIILNTFSYKSICDSVLQNDLPAPKGQQRN